jgi:hypothetical protein
VPVRRLAFASAVVENYRAQEDQKVVAKDAVVIMGNLHSHRNAAGQNLSRI